MTAFVLIFYLSVPLSNGASTLVAAEFSTQGKCEAAAKVAAAKFRSMITTPSWVCVEK